MPAADFCGTVTHLAVRSVASSATCRRPPEVSAITVERATAEFTLCVLDGLRTLRSIARSSDAHASYPVLVHQPASLLRASCQRRLTTTPERFAHPSPPSGWVEDLHLQVMTHARHTIKTTVPGQHCGFVFSPPTSSSNRRRWRARARPQNFREILPDHPIEHRPVL